MQQDCRGTGGSLYPALSIIPVECNIVTRYLLIYLKRTQENYSQLTQTYKHFFFFIENLSPGSLPRELTEMFVSTSVESELVSFIKTL